MRAVAAILVLMFSSTAWALDLGPDITLTGFSRTASVNVTGAPGAISCSVTLTHTHTIKSAGCTFESPGGVMRACSTATDGGGGVYSCDIELEADAEGGTWSLYRVFARDTNSPTAKYTATNAEVLADAANITGVSTSADLETTVTSTNQDLVGPTITDVSPVPLTAFQYLGGDVSCQSTITSNDTDSAGCTMTFSSTERSCSSYAPQSGDVWSCSINVPPDEPLGTVAAQGFARDNVGNRAYFQNKVLQIVVDGLDYDSCGAMPSDTGLPLAIDLDDDGNAWALGEFHESLIYASGSGDCTSLQGINIPHYNSLTKPFSDGNSPTQQSAFGESVVWDSNDDVLWFSQGGRPQLAGLINHSRVMYYDPTPTPTTGTFRAYNLPGDRNEAVGLHWDQARNWMWVAEYGFYSSELPANPSHEGSIIAFNPDVAKHDFNWRWELESDPDLSDELCWGSNGAGGAGGDPTTWDDPNDGCYKRYALPEFTPGQFGALAPAHLTVDSTGAVWFANFWGKSIGRLDPSTEEVILYPLEEGRGTCGTPCDTLGPGPWMIRISPDGQYAVFNEYFDNTIARIPLSRALDSECQALGAGGAGGGAGENPCIENIDIPSDLSEQHTHSIAYDADGRLWFTQDSLNRPATEGPNTIGYVTADFTQVVLLDHNDFTPDFNSAEDKTYTGIAINQTTGEIWVDEFKDSGLGKYVPE